MADLRLPRLNKVIIAGRIANELELKFTPKGTPVMRFVVACDRRYKDEAEEWQTATSWIDCVAWSWHAETLANNAHKGSAVMVEGRIDTRTWEDQNGNKRKSVEVVADAIHFLEWKPRDGEAPILSDEEAPLPKETMNRPSGATTDDVPF